MKLPATLKYFFHKLIFYLWYLKKPPWDTNQTPPELHEFIAYHPPGKALDLGCGTGTNVITLAKNGWQVLGVDFIPKAIRTARRKAAKENVDASFVVGDVTGLDWIDERFDLILDIGCFHCLDTSGKREYQINIKRLLSPVGTYLVYLFSNSDSGDSGITQSDLEPFSDFLELVDRQNGTERGIRKSSWLTYRRPIGQ